MKNKLIPILLIPLTSALVSCFPDDDSWLLEYGTPELFLENISDNPNVYLYENEKQYPDVDFEIKNLIKESGPFEKIAKRKPTIERYFTYEAYWQPATSGPNYCNMSIWDDGLIRIDHKRSLSNHSYVYFSMDAVKASSINDIVFEKLENVSTIGIGTLNIKIA